MPSMIAHVRGWSILGANQKSLVPFGAKHTKMLLEQPITSWVHVSSSSSNPPAGGPLHFERRFNGSDFPGFGCSSLAAQLIGTTPTNITTPPPPPPAPSMAAAMAAPAAAQPRRLPKSPHPTHILKCPRCASSDTKFCYYNNYSLSQPRYFCKNCKRYWTAGGALRNVPIGGGLRKNKRLKLNLQAVQNELAATAAAAGGSAYAEQPQRAYEVKPIASPRNQAATSTTVGCCNSTTAVASSVVPGLHANYAATAPPPTFLTPAPHYSSGSDVTGMDYADNRNFTHSDGAGTAVAATARAGPLEQQRKSRQPQLFLSDARGDGLRPQLYSNYASCCIEQQYSGSSGEDDGVRSSSCDHAAYGGSCCTQTTSPRRVEQFLGSDPVGRSTVVPSHIVERNDGAGAGQQLCGNHPGMTREEEEMVSSSSSYDWQFVSENLFNAEAFLPLLGCSWSDFSHFNDPSLRS